MRGRRLVEAVRVGRACRGGADHTRVAHERGGGVHGRHPWEEEKGVKTCTRPCPQQRFAGNKELGMWSGR